MHEAYRILKEDGIFIFSTPNVDFYPMAGLNPWHVKEYKVSEVRELLDITGFKCKDIFAQMADDEKIRRLDKSKLLLSIMKIKRKLGFNGDLMPSFLQKKLKNAIAGGELDNFDESQFQFVKDKIDEPELVYIASK